MKLNERIKACRIHCGLTQEQVAEAMNVSRQAVTKWESGQSAPSTENLFKLAELFHTTVDLLITDAKHSQPENSVYGFWKDKNFWISFTAGFVLLLVINPYGYNMYIPVLFTVLCVFLNIYSVLTFSVLLYKFLSNKPVWDDLGMYLGLLVFGLIGHGIFAIFSWGSWVCIGLSVTFMILLLVQKWKKNRKNIENST